MHFVLNLSRGFGDTRKSDCGREIRSFFAKTWRDTVKSYMHINHHWDQKKPKRQNIKYWLETNIFKEELQVCHLEQMNFQINVANKIVNFFLFEMLCCYGRCHWSIGVYRWHNVKSAVTPKIRPYFSKKIVKKRLKTSCGNFLNLATKEMGICRHRNIQLLKCKIIPELQSLAGHTQKQEHVKNCPQIPVWNNSKREWIEYVKCASNWVTYL